jgi:transcriptional regulator with XRE-family HTH domain
MTTDSALHDKSSNHDLYELKGHDLETFGFARVRDLAYDAVQELWHRRKSEGWTQAKLAKNLDRDTGWISRKLQGPGNWTFRTFGALVEGLRGEVEIKVRGVEDSVSTRQNWHAYVDYGTVPEELADEGNNIKEIYFRDPNCQENLEAQESMNSARIILGSAP